MVEVKKRAELLRSEKGAQLVEFALVLPLLLFVMLGIAEFGFIFHRYEVVTNAAREGARIAVLPNYEVGDVKARVESFLDAGRIPAAGRTPADVTYPTLKLADGTLIDMAKVTVTYTHTYMFIPRIASWFGAAYTTQVMSAVSEMRLEVPGS